MSAGERRLAGLRSIALDLDGVVYAGSRALPGAAEAVRRLCAAGADLHFVTNNSAQTRRQIAEKLRGLGIPAAAEEIVTSAYAAAQVVARLAAEKPGGALVVGSDGLREEVAAAGAAVVAANAPCGYLVVGLDRRFNYDSICLALDALMRGAAFIACNRDARFPVENGRFLPGCGAIVAAVESAAGRKPDWEVGKPNTTLLQIIAERDKRQPGEILVVGDSAASDILMAARFGSPSVLVGATDSAALPCDDGDESEPTYRLASLSELPALFDKIV